MAKLGNLYSLMALLFVLSIALFVTAEVKTNGNIQTPGLTLRHRNAYVFGEWFVDSNVKYNKEFRLSYLFEEPLSALNPDKAHLVIYCGMHKKVYFDGEIKISNVEEFNSIKWDTVPDSKHLQFQLTISFPMSPWVWNSTKYTHHLKICQLAPSDNAQQELFYFSADIIVVDHILQGDFVNEAYVSENCDYHSTCQDDKCMQAHGANIFLRNLRVHDFSSAEEPLVNPELTLSFFGSSEISTNDKDDDDHHHHSRRKVSAPPDSITCTLNTHYTGLVFTKKVAKIGGEDNDSHINYYSLPLSDIKDDHGVSIDLPQDALLNLSCNVHFEYASSTYRTSFVYLTLDHGDDSDKAKDFVHRNALLVPLVDPDVKEVATITTFTHIHGESIETNYVSGEIVLNTRPTRDVEFVFCPVLVAAQDTIEVNINYMKKIDKKTYDSWTLFQDTVPKVTGKRYEHCFLVHPFKNLEQDDIDGLDLHRPFSYVIATKGAPSTQHFSGYIVRVTPFEKVNSVTAVVLPELPISPHPVKLAPIRYSYFSSLTAYEYSALITEFRFIVEGTDHDEDDEDHHLRHHDSTLNTIQIGVSGSHTLIPDRSPKCTVESYAYPFPEDESAEEDAKSDFSATIKGVFSVDSQAGNTYTFPLGKELTGHRLYVVECHNLYIYSASNTQLAGSSVLQVTYMNEHHHQSLEEQDRLTHHVAGAVAVTPITILDADKARDPTEEGPRKSKSNLHGAAIFGIIMAIIVILAAAIFVFLCIKKKRTAEAHQASGGYGAVEA